MLKDVQYKSPVHIFYTNEFSLPVKDKSIDGNLLLPEMRIGLLQCKEENIRSYVLVNPEYYVWHPTQKEKRITWKIVWQGGYFINKDRLMITAKDVYECWIDTTNEISEFIKRSLLSRIPVQPPRFEQVQNEFQKFVDSLKSIT